MQHLRQPENKSRTILTGFNLGHLWFCKHFYVGKRHEPSFQLFYIYFTQLNMSFRENNHYETVVLHNTCFDLSYYIDICFPPTESDGDEALNVWSHPLQVTMWLNQCNGSHRRVRGNIHYGQIAGASVE